MSEMVERVARAIAVDALRQNPMLEIMDGGLGYYDDYDNKAYDCVKMARAAIEAMRDIPPEAIDGAWGFGVSDWNAVIDRLLSPAPPSEE